MPDTRKAALKYAEYHWPIFPLIANGKEPLTPDGFKNATIDAEIIKGWWQRWPNANIGLACGMSGVIALDGDPFRYTDESRALIADLLENYPTATQITPTGGHHFVYMLPAGVTLSNSSGNLPPGVDVRVNGFIALSPSTVTYTGEKAKEKGVEDGFSGRYRWQPSPIDFPPQPLPDHILEMLKPKVRPEPIPIHYKTNGHNGNYAKAALERELDILARTREGGRNEQLNKSAFSLGQLVAAGLLSESEVGDKLLSVGLAIGLEEREVRATIRSGLASGEKQPRVVPEEPRLRFRKASGEPAAFKDAAHFTDMGNAQRMHALVQGKVFYVPQFDKWYMWAGTHWQEDSSFEIVKFAKQTVMNMYAEAATLDDEKRKELVKWAVKSEARQRLEAAIALLRSEPNIAIQPDELDRDPLLLACRNGTLDLRHGELLSPDPDHLITKCIEADYDPDVDCPLWEKFLIRIMDNNFELVSFIQRLVGHALTGDASGKYLVFMYGPKGNNGKSTLVETIMRLLGPYAMKSPSEMIMAKTHRGGIPNDIARLRGVRFTVTNEVDEGMTLSESVIKDLTGNDTLTARFMRAEFFDFAPTHKLWIYGNHKPEIHGTDTAIWDRVKLIPFDVEIPKSERDPLLPQKLMAELPGILAWAVRGNMLWQRMGIAAPEIVAQATGEYRTEQDTVGQFLIDCCETGISYEVAAGSLYRTYEAWAKQLGLRPEGGTKFGTDLSRRGFGMKKNRLGKMRVGLQLNEFGRSLGPAPATHWSDEK